MAIEPATVSEIFRERLREFRTRRGWKQEDLARRILELEGEPASKLNARRTMVARTESGDRSVSINDMFLFAAALGVSPFALVLDNESELPIEIAPRLTLPTWMVARWALAGDTPLRSDDIDIYTASSAFWRWWWDYVPTDLIDDKAIRRPEVAEMVRAWIANRRRWLPRHRSDQTLAADLAELDETEQRLQQAAAPKQRRKSDGKR